MDLSKIMAISGKPGLFKSIAHTKNGIVVESLLDGKRFTAFVHERVSSLEEISVFTSGEDMSIKEVLKRIFNKEQGQKAIDTKSDQKALLAYFEELVPEYDKERVYASDIKKVLSWYNILQEKEMLDFTEEEKKEEETKEDSAEKKEETTN
jgi:hypothetical protein